MASGGTHPSLQTKNANDQESADYTIYNNHGLQQTECKRNTSSRTPTRECMFFATTSGDAGRCTGQPGLDSSKVPRCMPHKEAGERSTEDVTTTI